MRTRIKAALHAGLKKGLLIPALLLSLNLSAQMEQHATVQLPGGQMTYGDIFKAVEKQTDYWFGYPIKNVELTREVNVPQGYIPITTLLDQLFDGSVNRWVISDSHILILSETTNRFQTPPPNYLNNAEPVSYGSYKTRRPVVALKTNLLYDLTTTVNLGVEIGLGPRWTLDVPVNVNLWKLGDTRLLHWLVQPEIRVWTCERFNGWFFGLHGHYAQFNVGHLPDWLASENMQKNRYEGSLYGAGLSVGYTWILKKRWSMEATVGAGYARINTTKYPCLNCGVGVDKGGKNYFGPTKIGLSLIYTIK